MGNTIFIRDKRVCVRPLRNRIEVIQKLEPPTTIKGCRSFLGMVNFVSIFCPELKKLLKPIYNLTGKGRQFIWGEEQQKAFHEIKCRLQRPPVLHLPDRHGRFQLYSDTSKFATGHLATMHIMRCKAEPATTRIKSLIELLSPYSFNLYYIKGKDMVLSDFLSRQKTDDSDPHEIIPISFTLKSLSRNISINLTGQLELVRQKQISI